MNKLHRIAQQLFDARKTSDWESVKSAQSKLLVVHDELATLRQQLAEAQAKLADHEAAMAGAVEVVCQVKGPGPEWCYSEAKWHITDEEYAALLPLDGETVLVVRKPT